VRRESLNIKILILTISLFVICSLMYGISFSYQSKTALMEEFTTRGNSLVKNLALNAELEILIENIKALESLAKNLLQEKDVQNVKIMDENKKILVDVSKQDNLSDEYKETMSIKVARKSDKNISDLFTLPLGEKETMLSDKGAQIIGYIEVVFSKEGVINTISKMRRDMFLSALVATIIGCMVALYFSISIVKPVRRLAKATTRIAK